MTLLHHQMVLYPKMENFIQLLTVEVLSTQKWELTTMISKRKRAINRNRMEILRKHDFKTLNIIRYFEILNYLWILNFTMHYIVFYNIQ